MSDVFVRIKTEYDNSGIVKADKALGGLLNNILKGSAVVAAFGLAVTKAFDFSQQGAQILRLEKSGSSLAASYGANMNSMLSELKKASRGTIAETDLMLSANRAMMLGVTDDAQQMANLLEVAALRGRAMGLSTSQAFNDIVTGIGRMSPLILDNLGIVTNLDARVKAWAAANGVAADKVDDATKRQILLNAVLEDGNKQLALTGGLLDDTATSYEKFGAQGADAMNRLKKAAGEFFEPLVSGAADGLENLNTLNDALDLTGARIQIVRGEGGEMSRMFEMANGELIDQNELLFRYNILLGATSKTLGDDFVPNIEAGIKAGGGLEDFLRAGEKDLRDFGGAATAAASDLVDFYGAAKDNPLKDLFDIDAAAQFNRMGGQGLVGLIDQIKTDIAEAGGVIDEELAAEIEHAAIEAAALQVALGNMTAEEAVEALSELSVPIDDALQRVQTISRVLAGLDGSEFNVMVNVNGMPRNHYNVQATQSVGRATGGELNPSDGVVKVGEHGMEYVYWDPKKKQWVVLEHGKSMKAERGLAVGGPLAGTPPPPSGGNVPWTPRGSDLIANGPGSYRILPATLLGLTNDALGNAGYGPPSGSAAGGGRGGRGGGGNERGAAEQAGAAAAAVAVQAASQAATQAATAAAAGVGSAVASQASQASAQAIATFTQQSSQQSANLLEETKIQTEAIRNLPTKNDLKNAVREALAEAI